MAATIDPSAFDVLTFDCYGTLIDWETGLLTALRAELAGAVAGVSDEELLEAFAAVEHAAEIPYQPYRDVLAQALREVGARYGAAPSAEQQARFGGSVPDWPGSSSATGSPRSRTATTTSSRVRPRGSASRSTRSSPRSRQARTSPTSGPSCWPSTGWVSRVSGSSTSRRASSTTT